MTLYWSSPRVTLTGGGDVVRYDPMLGPDRYSRASDWLDSTGRELAFASFTFDPDAPGSVVLAPETVLAPPPIRPTPIPSGVVVDDGADDWHRGFDLATEALDEGVVEKVVVARQVKLEFDGPVPTGTVLARLVRDNPGTYAFAIEGLVGACPELLVSVDRDRVTALVLAGTASSREALADEMIVVEHRHAADSVAEALAPRTFDLVGEQSALSFGQINHVGTRFVGRLRPGLGILDLVAALHPNAAVGGTPPQAALDLIRRIEPVSRGRYAGPIGWFDRAGNGEFSLALRCGLIRSGTVTLYAGGGLVPGSPRQREWDETTLKLTPMLGALGLA